MNYDDYPSYYRMPFQTESEAQKLGDLHYEQDQVGLKLQTLRYVGVQDRDEYEQLAQLDAEYALRIDAIMRTAVNRQHTALLENFAQRGMVADEWYFVDIMREWITIDSDLDRDYCVSTYEHAVDEFRKTIEIPDRDIELIDAEKFRGFMHAVMVRGDSAFHCRMLGREIKPLKGFEASS